MHEERRLNRSINIYDALGHQLAACAERARLSSLVLAEDQGLLVASIGDPLEAEEIAALAPRLAPDTDIWHGTVRTAEGIKSATICPLITDSGRVYLCAVGEVGTTVDTELFRSGQGVRRILH
jgi:hypothetical protein